MQPLEQKVKEETHTSNVQLVANVPNKITHNLRTKKVNVAATGVEGKTIKGKTVIIDSNTIEFIPFEDAPQGMITIKGKPGDQSFARDLLDLTARMLIGVKTVSITYNNSGGTVLPGYMPEPVLFGAGNYTPDQRLFGRQIPESFAPGLPFLMGWQERRFAQRAAENGWITSDSTLNLPYLFTKNERFYLNATIEPLPDVRIDLTAERSFSKNISEFYNYNHQNKKFVANSLNETGNFSMSTFTWGTAFFAIGGKELSESGTFSKLKENRMIIARRLAAQRNPNNGFGYDPTKIDPKTGFPDGYGPNSVEVLVPAFLAAYQNADPYKISLDMFPSVKFIRPNWTIRYEGMVSRIPGLNRIIRSLNFNHAYRSTYNVGSFLTNLNYETQGDGFSYVRDLANNFIPAFEFNSVNIMETFSPLINVDIIWVSDLTTRAEMKRTRNLNLAFANGLLTEMLSDEYSIGAGYRFTRMDLIIKTKNSQQKYSNDLNLRVDLSIRKNKTNLRSLMDVGDQITQGSSSLNIKTTADYQLSDRFQLQLFFDRIMNNPFVATAFKTANTNVGVSFRFTLTQ
jgi:cell surface protein SprA